MDGEEVHGSVFFAVEEAGNDLASYVAVVKGLGDFFFVFDGFVGFFPVCAGGEGGAVPTGGDVLGLYGVDVVAGVGGVVGEELCVVVGVGVVVVDVDDGGSCSVVFVLCGDWQGGDEYG